MRHGTVKDVFLGQEDRRIHELLHQQRCVRAGGKHNELRACWYTARHILSLKCCNFSFGDISNMMLFTSLEFLVKKMGLPPEKIMELRFR